MIAYTNGARYGFISQRNVQLYTCGRHPLEPRAAEYINTRGRSTYSNVYLSVGVLTNDTRFLAF